MVTHSILGLMLIYHRRPVKSSSVGAEIKSLRCRGKWSMAGQEFNDELKSGVLLAYSTHHGLALSYHIPFSMALQAVATLDYFETTRLFPPTLTLFARIVKVIRYVPSRFLERKAL